MRRPLDKILKMVRQHMIRQAQVCELRVNGAFLMVYKRPIRMDNISPLKPSVPLIGSY